MFDVAASSRNIFLLASPQEINDHYMLSHKLLLGGISAYSYRLFFVFSNGLDNSLFDIMLKKIHRMLCNFRWYYDLQKWRNHIDSPSCAVTIAQFKFMIFRTTGYAERSQGGNAFHITGLLGGVFMSCFRCYLTKQTVDIPSSCWWCETPNRT